MPPRTFSERSPVSVMMRWDDSSTISNVDIKPNTKDIPLSPKSVRFTEENEVLEIPHLDDIPDSDVEAIWYSAKEYSDIKASYQLTIFMMESGEKISSDNCEHTTRGLEYRTQEGAWARYENKRDAYNAVLDEQDRQWKVDKDDFEKLREIYLSHSTKCAQAAVVRALQDEQDIKDYLATDLLKPRRKKKKIIVVKKKKKKSTSSGESDSEGNATDTSNRSSRSTKSVSKKKAKEITEKLKRRAAASGGDKASAILSERSSLARAQFDSRKKSSA